MLSKEYLKMYTALFFGKSTRYFTSFLTNVNIIHSNKIIKPEMCKNELKTLQ